MSRNYRPGLFLKTLSIPNFQRPVKIGRFAMMNRKRVIFCQIAEGKRQFVFNMWETPEYYFFWWKIFVFTLDAFLL